MSNPEINVSPNLPAMEEELVGKTYPELYSLAAKYLVAEGDSRQRQVFERRARGLIYQANLLRAREIMDNPAATSGDDLKFVAMMIWNETVLKTFAGRLKTHPDHRARIIDQNGRIDGHQATAEEVAAYEEWLASSHEQILQQVLDELPDPEGKIHSASELQPMEAPGR